MLVYCPNVVAECCLNGKVPLSRYVKQIDYRGRGQRLTWLIELLVAENMMTYFGIVLTYVAHVVMVLATTNTYATKFAVSLCSIP